MRILLAFLLALAAGAVDALDTARTLAASGATRLALARVEQLQPKDTAAQGWWEWEALRIELLAGLGRHAEVLKRTEALPANMSRPLLRGSLLAAARSGVAAGQGAAARRHAARLLWQLEPTPAEIRAARLVVIDSYVAERQGDPAFRAMLRFQQDYAPLDRATAERFVEALLALNLQRDAVNWLASLEDGGPVKLLLRLRTGLDAPDSAIAQARAGLAKGGGAGYWRVLSEAARQRNDLLLAVEALEQLANVVKQLAAGAEVDKAAASLAAELWEAYRAGAQDAANRNQLLSGDDAAWADFAARRIASAPPLARAFFAHLARQGRERETRFNAQLQLVFSLQQAKLERTALRLFEGAAPEDVDAQARYLLGAMAERSGQPALAAKLWKGLPAPPGSSTEEWQARLGAAYWRADMGDAALETLRGLLATAKALPPEAARQLTSLAQEMVVAGKFAPADEVLRGLLPLSEPRQQREILLALGRVAESSARFQAAADYYLRSALLAGKAPDALALQARLAAALNLVQAGYREDARAQLQWLLKNATDPGQLDIVKRELARL